MPKEIEMQAGNEMRWILDQFTRGDIRAQKIDMAKRAMESLISRVPHDQDIDVEGTAKAAIAIAKTMAAEMAKEGWI